MVVRISTSRLFLLAGYGKRSLRKLSCLHTSSYNCFEFVYLSKSITNEKKMAWSMVSLRPRSTFAGLEIVFYYVNNLKP